MLLVSQWPNANGALGHSISSKPRHMKAEIARNDMLKLKKKLNTPTKVVVVVMMHQF